MGYKTTNHGKVNLGEFKNNPVYAVVSYFKNTDSNKALIEYDDGKVKIEIKPGDDTGSGGIINF